MTAKPILAQTQAPASAQVPAEGRPRRGPVPLGVNLAITAGGIGIGLLAFKYRKKPLGAIMIGAGGSVVGAGLVLILLNIINPGSEL